MDSRSQNHRFFISNRLHFDQQRSNWLCGTDYYRRGMRLLPIQYQEEKECGRTQIQRPQCYDVKNGTYRNHGESRMMDYKNLFSKQVVIITTIAKVIAHKKDMIILKNK